MGTLTLASYSKINLTLEVSQKRPDGYHDIDSVVQVIDIADELVVDEAGSGTIEVRVESGGAPSGRDNLVYRAAEAFFEATGISGGAKFLLKKHIPAEAGLGGGSGNAAAAIAALDHIYGCNLPSSELASIASKVGSDTALFIYGGTVRMRGRGEYIETLPDAPGLDLVVIKPNVGVSTAWAYAELDKRTVIEKTRASDRVERAVRKGSRAELVLTLQNDFDEVVTAAFEEVAAAKSSLIERGAMTVLLSGSGSAVFGVFDSHSHARAVADELTQEFDRVFVARSLTRRDSSLFGREL